MQWLQRSIANIPDLGRYAKAIILHGHDEAEMVVVRMGGCRMRFGDEAELWLMSDRANGDGLLSVLLP